MLGDQIQQIDSGSFTADMQDSMLYTIHKMELRKNEEEEEYIWKRRETPTKPTIRMNA